VKNVVQQKKAGANRKSVLTVLKQEPWRSRKIKKLQAAAAPVQQKNNPSIPGPCQNYMAGASFFHHNNFFYSRLTLLEPDISSKCCKVEISLLLI
jgi:hypothetical protein